MTDLIGREPDRLTIPEQRALAGHWIALEMYTPKNLALRRIAAVGESASDCVAQLTARGANPREFEFRAYKTVSQ